MPPDAPIGADRILNEIRRVAHQIGRTPSRPQFIAETGLSEYRILRHFPSWSSAVSASGLTPDSSNIRLDDATLLADWGELVRLHRRIPTRNQYRREGHFSPGSFETHLGPWSSLPRHFRTFAQNDPSWADVVALLPEPQSPTSPVARAEVRQDGGAFRTPAPAFRHSKLEDRPTYGNPIDFRGLRHEPVNEQGVVFLFGMLARELGYLVEAVQAGYPDCEAKRQVAPDKWQRVRIEFEFESRNFRDHGHQPSHCDAIVCWRHNWADCPLEVVELSSILQTLGDAEDFG
jgi:hypothetical protein